MNDRKQHVINKAHQLFIDKGFQATSIQDILDYSGISKGTFYNYFSSKNELLIAIFTSLYEAINKKRNELLIGQKRSDIEVFMKQIELSMKANKKFKLLSLFEEVFISNDPALKEFIKRGQLMQLRWTFERFVDIFGEEKKPYLLDCSIMFMGVLHHNLHYQFMANESGIDFQKVIRYSVERIVKVVEEVSKSGIQLMTPDILEKWLPDSHQMGQDFQRKLFHTILELKKCLNDHPKQHEYIELLDFIQEEMVHSKSPRRFLISSTLSSLKENQEKLWQTEIKRLEELIKGYFD